MEENVLKMYRCDMNHDDGSSTITFEEFDVVRQTLKCVWIKDYRAKLRRVTKEDGSKNPFAFTTKKAALYNFIMRKKRHSRILNHNIKLVRKAIEVANEKHVINDFTDCQISHYDI